MNKEFERIEAAFRLLGDLELSGGVCIGALVSSSYEYKTIREDLDIFMQNHSIIHFVLDELVKQNIQTRQHIDQLKEIL